MRQTPAEIDTQIIDAAAQLFSVQGFDRTSVQQIADAVGYSKTGLLHRFSSKQALREAADALIGDAIEEIFELHASIADAPDHRHRLLTTIADAAQRYPGLVQYLLHGLHTMQPADSVLQELKDAAERLIEILVGPGADDATQFKAVLALELICSGIVLARDPEHPWQAPDLGPLLVRLAESVIDTR